MRLHQRHLDEAEFLFEVFDAALDAPRYDLAKLGRGPERRLWAQVDGLIVAGADPCARTLLPVLHAEDAAPSRVAAASLALAELPLLATPAATDALARLRAPAPAAEPTWSRLLDAHDACPDPARRRALCRGMALSSDPGLAAWAAARLGQAQDEQAMVGPLSLLVGRGVAPPGLARMLSAELPELLRLALEATKLSREPEVLARLAALGRTPDPRLREVALESALIHGIAGAWDSALYWAFTPDPSPSRTRALIWVALLGDARVHGWLVESLAESDAPELLLWVLGFTGRAAAVDAAMPWLEHPQLGPLAAELVVAITGLDVEEPGCWLPAGPEDAGEDGALPPLADDDLDADLVPASTEALPRPDPAEIQTWWRPRRDQLRPDRRYLGGRELTAAVLLDGLHHGPMRRRPILALELALRSHGALQLPTRQTTRRQHQRLTAIAAWPQLASLDLQRGHGQA